MALPNSNISVAMVKSELGAATNNVGQLCIHPNVNKWSKWKPVRHSSVTPLTEAELKSASSGMDIPFVIAHPSSGYVSIMDYYRNNPNLKWIYNKPRGGLAEPRRLSDFSNYEKAAEIFYDFIVPDRIVNNTLRVDFNSYKVPNWLDWDFLNLEDYHFGVLVVRKNQTAPFFFKFADFNLMGGDNKINLSLTPPPSDGTIYDVFAFIGMPSEDLEDPDNINFYMLEDGHKEVVFVKVLTVSMNNEYMGWGVEYGLHITNNSSTAPEVLTQVELVFRYADNGIDDELEPLEPFETILQLGTLTIPPLGSLSISDQTQQGILPELPQRGGYIYFRSASHPSYNGQFPIVYS